MNASLSFNGCHMATFGWFVCLFSCMVRIITSQSIICRRGCWKNWHCPLSKKTYQDYMQVMLRCFLRRQRQSTSRFVHHRYIRDICFYSPPLNPDVWQNEWIQRKDWDSLHLRNLYPSDCPAATRVRGYVPSCGEGEKASSGRVSSWSLCQRNHRLRDEEPHPDRHQTLPLEGNWLHIHWGKKSDLST